MKRLDNFALDEARYQGDLLVAKDVYAMARIIYKRHLWTSFPITFSDKTYWFEIDTKAYHRVIESKSTDENKKVNELDDMLIDEVIKETSTIKEIANCVFTPLYFQRDRYTDEAHYFMRITIPQSAEVLNM